MLSKLKTIKINTLGELSKRLGIELGILQDVAEHLDIHYEKFLKKIGSKERMLYEADHSLGEIHKRIERRLLDRFDFPFSIQGGIKGRSLLTNAQPHVKRINVGHFDIKNFFPSVRPNRIYNVLYNLGCAPNVAHLLARLTTADRHLPQGFRTSPKIAALVLLNMDKRLAGFLKRYGMRHTIWVDDLAISGTYPIRKLSSGIRRIVQQEGFECSKEKEEISYSNQRQLVAGVVVNSKPSVRKEKRREVERIIFNCEKLGARTYLAQNPQGLNVRSFVKMVDGKLSSMLAIDEQKYRPLYQKWKEIIMPVKKVI